MNPPSALYGAMNKERKPFTYTPGGLDLSEIKSERMAQRLMRNAMSQGIPETQVQTIQSPPAQINSSAIPNFNCLPVQVFPTFALPANPKSLLRSRSNTDAPKEGPQNKIPVPSPFISVDKHTVDQRKIINKPSLFTVNNNGLAQQTNNTKRITNNVSLLTPTNYGSEGHTEIILPEKSYDAEYFVSEPQGNIKLLEKETNKLQEYARPITDIFVDTTANDIEKIPVAMTSSSTQDRTTDDNEQKKVKIVKKQTKTSGNEADQNGDSEAAVVVKLPSKKSSAKTETQVEVLKKILPDGAIEEVKTTITKTTIDGKTEIKTETETRTLPKDGDDDTVEIEEQEEESEDVIIEDQHEEEELEDSTTITSKQSSQTIATENDARSKEKEIKENGCIISGEEKLEISTTKNVVVIQAKDQESEEEQEEEVEEETEDLDVEVEQVILLKKVDVNSGDKVEKGDSDKEDETEEVEEEELVEDENVDDEQENVTEEVIKDAQELEKVEDVDADEADAEEVETEEVEAEEVEAEEEEEAEEVEAEEVETEEAEEIEAKEVKVEEDQNENLKVEEQDKIKNQIQEQDTTAISSEEILKPKEEANQNDKEVEVLVKTEEKLTEVKDKESIITEQVEQKTESSQNAPTNQETPTESCLPKDDINKQPAQAEQEHVLKIKIQSEPKVSFREPSIPLEKVEDVEIKPIGPAQEIIKKCHTEIITTTKDEPTGALSTQTNYNRIENIVTVNRTTKTLDHAYEQAESTIPGMKSYYVPPSDRILSTPQPISRPYQPVFTSEPQTERRHSLLLDRLSIERQIPVQQPQTYQNNYQYNNQNSEQNQWSQEPQSEVLTVSNVKPSEITKNQQWYQQTKREENYSTNIVTPTPVMPSLLSQPQPQAQVAPPYQSYVQPAYTPTPDFQPSYTDSKQNSFKSGTNSFQQNTYPSYTPKPSWVSSTTDSKPAPATQYNQYSTLKKESNENYQNSTQPFTSSYVPPPWEQDSSYVVENQSFYQPPLTTVYNPSINQSSWKPTQPASKFSKPPPTAYIPPAPNQSFVKPVSSADSNLLPGRKTYYSEYERRYISVPESTYIPNETKYQAQPDPSPQYYFDNNESSETVEPQWRKELREFTEKTSLTTTSQTEKTSVRPPWEEDPKYASGYTSTVTKSWTQSLRPRSWRETSYEPEYIGSKEWPKTNTLGRGRPQSSYARNNVDIVRERTRGVSVDRYNPNSYQPPLSSEHPPVKSHTLNPNIHPKAYHNPSVPAYHARTSAEPREQTAPYIQRTWADSKAPPVQSRSFKYLQWITGTED